MDPPIPMDFAQYAASAIGSMNADPQDESKHYFVCLFSWVFQMKTSLTKNCFHLNFVIRCACRRPEQRKSFVHGFQGLKRT